MSKNVRQDLEIAKNRIEWGVVVEWSNSSCLRSHGAEDRIPEEDIICMFCFKFRTNKRVTIVTNIIKRTEKPFT